MLLNKIRNNTDMFKYNTIQFITINLLCFSESFSYSMDDDCIVIADVYDSNEMAYNVLEQALETEAAMIVIEPYQLGDETSRWIRVGNCLHKTTVLTAAGCFIFGQLFPKNNIGCVSLSLGSLLCATIYAISWQFDPCCKYQVETDAKKLAQIPFESLSSTSPVVLVRKDDTRRKILHNSLAVASGIYCAMRCFQWYQQSVLCS